MHAHVCALLCKQKDALVMGGLCSETLHLKKIPRIPLSMENNAAEVLLVCKVSVCMVLETVVIEKICVCCGFLNYSKTKW